MPVTTDQLRAICPLAPLARLQQLAPAIALGLHEADAETPARAALFLAQTAHESVEWTRFVEGMSYSAQGLVSTWPRRFPSLATAAPYARHPERTANRVYADRLGNGDEAGGDGWRYRGRGAIQITGADAYRAAGLALGLELLAHPELVEQPEAAFRTAGWWWRAHGLTALADARDVRGATLRINGGTLGLDQRLAYYSRALAALGA